MARRIKEVRRRVRTFPWPQWTDGSAWKAVKGIDFACEPAVFRNRLAVYASRNDFSLRTSIDGDRVEFQFTPRTEARRKETAQ